MQSRTTIIYIAAGFVALSLIYAGYFFFRKPERIVPPSLNEGKAVIVFKDVKYSGEKKGVIDWEIRAKIARKFTDKPIVEMEQMEGEYKPKAGTIVRFKGSKGSMDTEEETGTVDDVRVIHNNDYTMTTKYMDFDFQKGLTTTSAPVTIEGSRLTLMGVGLIANTKEETIRIVKNVTGFVQTKKVKYRFAGDTFVYFMKENQYLLDGNAMMTGDDMKVTCAKLYIYTDGDDLEKIDARGKVRLYSKGSVAKSERAVYHFNADKAVSNETTKAGKDHGSVAGKATPIKPVRGKAVVEKSKTGLEK